MKRATKKACGSLDTVLSPDFISRALESNPLELLNNEALKFECLFCPDPLPEFRAYHDPCTEKTFSIIEDHTRSGFSTVKSEQHLALAFALRRDIPKSRVLYFALHLKNKKLLSHVVKVHPWLSDWETVFGLYNQSSLIGMPRFRKAWTSLVGYNYTSLFEMHKRITSPAESYGAFKSIFQKSLKGHRLPINNSVIKSQIPSVLKDSDRTEVLWNILLSSGVSKGYECSSLSLMVIESIRGPQSRYSTLEDMREFLSIYAVLFSRACAEFRHTYISKILHRDILKRDRSVFYTILDEMLCEEYQTAGLLPLQYHEAIESNPKWTWLKDSWFHTYCKSRIGKPC